MTLDELKTLLLTIDPALSKWVWDGQSRDYTVWTPHHRTSLMSDDKPERVTIKVTIDRYTKDPDDLVPGQILDALEDRYVPTDEMLTTYDEKAGTFRYIIECYVTAMTVQAEEEPEDNEIGEDPVD